MISTQKVKKEKELTHGVINLCHSSAFKLCMALRGESPSCFTRVLALLAVLGGRVRMAVIPPKGYLGCLSTNSGEELLPGVSGLPVGGRGGWRCPEVVAGGGWAPVTSPHPVVLPCPRDLTWVPADCSHRPSGETPHLPSWDLSLSL